MILVKQNNTFPLKHEFKFTELECKQWVSVFSKQLILGDRIFLEGPRGAGKTTFVRYLLESLEVDQPPQGSPTFSIAHEYTCSLGGVVHIDYDRIHSLEEIYEAGIHSYYWERPLIVISEWISLWSDFRYQVLSSGRTWQMNISFEEENRTLQYFLHSN
jgi:tRNA threonylcarbamoyl adenosine modification protein YjeE